MRIIPKAFTGFICGQYMVPVGGSQTYEGVMEYRDGKQIRLYIPCHYLKVADLYKQLNRGVDFINDRFERQHVSEIFEINAS